MARLPGWLRGRDSAWVIGVASFTIALGLSTAFGIVHDRGSGAGQIVFDIVLGTLILTILAFVALAILVTIGFAVFEAWQRSRNE